MQLSGTGQSSSSAGRVVTEDRQNAPADGLALVAFASALWGTDALFRRGLALSVPAVSVVFWEHLLLASVMAVPLLRARRLLARLDRRDWWSIVVIGAGASATATIAFTSALAAGDPTTPLLLQKAQPVLVVAAGALILGERPTRRFFWIALPALVGVYLITFAQPARVTLEAAWPAVLGLTAASLWGLGTVLGRRMSLKVPFAALAGLRFTVGLPAAAVLVAAFGRTSLTPARSQILPLLLLALVPGLTALMLYYRGLRATPASLATLAELSFPLTAVMINRLAFGVALTVTQWLGIALLSGAVIGLERLSRHGSQAAGVILTSVERPNSSALAGRAAT